MPAVYTLGKDGDSWERRWWPYLRDTFPNYQTFWQRFIAGPLTTRPHGIHIRDGIDSTLEEMAMAHYSVFRHLAATHWLVELNAEIQQNTPDGEWSPTLHVEAFFHLSAATEMIERLVFIIWKIAVKIGELPSIQPLSDDETLELKIREYVDSKSYLEGFNRFERTGQSVNIRLHFIRDVQKAVSDIMTETSAWKHTCKEFNTLVDQKIRRYRNILTHNPQLGSIESNGNLLIPTASTLGKYPLWSSVFYEREDADFVSVDDIIEELLNALEELANRMWDHLIAMMNHLSNRKEYTKLLGASQFAHYTIAGVVGSQDPSDLTGGSATGSGKTGSHPVRPSGTFSIDPSQQ